MTRSSAPTQVERLLQDAESTARSVKQAHLGIEHVLISGIEGHFLDTAFAALCVKTETAALAIRDLLQADQDTPTSADEPLPRTPRLKRVLDHAMETALKESSKDMLPSHVLKSILEEKNGLPALALVDLGISPAALLQAISEPPASSPPAPRREENKVKTPLLDKLGRDLTQMARDGKLDPVIGRTEELRRVMQILSRKTKNVPLLIGEAGVGKTAVAFLLAQRLFKGTVPQAMMGKRLVELPLSSIVAGTAHRGELEERVQKILQEASSDPNLILFIDEIHGLVGTGSATSGMEVGNMLKPQLADGSIRVIGSTTTEEYQKYLSKDAALERRFQPVLVKEPSEEETEQILQGLKNRYEQFHGVSFEEEALQQAIKLSTRYLPDRRLPDKALDLLDEAASLVKMKTAVGSAPSVGKEDIAKVISLWTGIPVQKLTVEDKERFLDLEQHLKSRVIGQEEAVGKISEVIRISKAGLANPKKPMGIFLFLGPTGVGKTELAKTIAETLFGNPDTMIRLDMSEYKEKHSLARLIGAPPGYVGHQEEGQLTKAVRAKPYSIILLDEVEKAHPEVLDLFLQIFDDGRLTDSKGRTVNFTNTLIVMTSNSGAQLMLSGIEKNVDKEMLREQVMAEVKTSFRPEFLNRIDEIILFNPLSRASLEAIIQLRLRDLQERLSEQKITLRVSQAVINLLIEKGYEPAFGARPLKRAVQQILAKPIAQAILKGTYAEGSTITADIEDSNVTLRLGGDA